MKSRDRLEREREKRSMMWSLIALGFILLVVCAMMILSLAGDGTSVGNFMNVFRLKIQEAWDVIWFKISNFLAFLKRGI